MACHAESLAATLKEGPKELTLLYVVIVHSHF